jgi:hypothetical protein
MMRKFVFIGIIFFLGSCGSEFVFANTTKTTDELSKEATEKIQKAEEGLVKLKADPAIQQALTDLKNKKKVADTKLTELKTTLKEIQGKIIPEIAQLETLKALLAAALGPNKPDIEAAITAKEATIATKKIAEIKTAEATVNTQETEVANIKEQIDNNPISAKEKEIAGLKNDNAISKLAYETSAGFNVTKYLRVTDTSNEVNLNIVTDKQNDTDNIFYKIIRLMTQGIGSFAILMLIIGGFFMITSKGDESRLTKGKNIFTNTLIGVVVAFLSYLVVTVIVSVIF